MNNYDIIICSGGKCGSCTLFKTFTNNGYETLHTHGSFSNENIKSINELFRIQTKKKIYVFDSYRTPIERHVSGFFENINHYISKPLESINIDMLIYYYNKYFINFEDYHPLDSIIPVFKKGFDFDKNYIKRTIIENGKEFIFVKIRFESIHLWDKILSEILEKPITLHNDNISENKFYAKLYKEFKNNYLVPREYLKQIQIYPTFIRYNNESEKEEYIKNGQKNQWRPIYF